MPCCVCVMLLFFTSSSEVIRGYDFLVNAVWPEVIANIEARTPSIFAPGNPDVFHQVIIINTLPKLIYWPMK